MNFKEVSQEIDQWYDDDVMHRVVVLRSGRVIGQWRRTEDENWSVGNNLTVAIADRLESLKRKKDVSKLTDEIADKICDHFLIPACSTIDHTLKWKMVNRAAGVAVGYVHGTGDYESIVARIVARLTGIAGDLAILRGFTSRVEEIVEEMR